MILRAVFRLIPADEKVEQRESLDVLGAVLITVGMLLLVYTIVEAPNVGWGDARTVGGFAVAGLILASFIAYEARHPNPIFPFSIFRVKGLAAADVTMVTAMAGFYTMFLLITLYMQNVLGLSKLAAGSAYLPPTLGVALSAGIATQLMGKVGTRPVIVGGAILGAGGIFWLSKIPVDGSYWSNVLPGADGHGARPRRSTGRDHHRRTGRRTPRQGRSRRGADQLLDVARRRTRRGDLLSRGELDHHRPAGPPRIAEVRR